MANIRRMRPRSFPRLARRSAATRGFTLIEMLMALVLIEIGLLALAASSAVVIREIVLVRARTSALERARNRVETLAASPCVAVSGSGTGPNGLREDWSTRMVAVSTREIRDSITFTLRRVTRTVVLHTRTPCAS